MASDEDFNRYLANLEKLEAATTREISLNNEVSEYINPECTDDEAFLNLHVDTAKSGLGDEIQKTNGDDKMEDMWSCDEISLDLPGEVSQNEDGMEAYLGLNPVRQEQIDLSDIGGKIQEMSMTVRLNTFGTVMNHF